MADLSCVGLRGRDARDRRLHPRRIASSFHRAGPPGGGRRRGRSSLLTARSRTAARRVGPKSARRTAVQPQTGMRSDRLTASSRRALVLTARPPRRAAMGDRSKRRRRERSGSSVAPWLRSREYRSDANRVYDPRADGGAASSGLAATAVAKARAVRRSPTRRRKAGTSMQAPAGIYSDLREATERQSNGEPKY